MEIVVEENDLFLEPHKVLEQFNRVIHEKEAVVNAYYSYEAAVEKHGNASGSCIVADGVNEIARAVKTLCGYFVDEQESHAKAIPHSYENFPRTLSERFRNDQEHSLGPDIMTQYESFPSESLAKYRRLLSNCAYWLNQMYMIEVPLQHNNSSWGDYMQGVTQEWSFPRDDGDGYQSELYWSDYYSHEPGDVPEYQRGYYRQKPVEVSGFTERAGRNMMQISYSVGWYPWNDIRKVRVNPGESPAKYIWVEDHWGATWEYEGRKRISYMNSGLWVDNRAPFDGICRCFVIKDETNHGKSSKYGQGNVDWVGTKRPTQDSWGGLDDQYEKWENINIGAVLCSDLYTPESYEDDHWNKFPGKIDDTKINMCRYIITTNGIKIAEEDRDIKTYKTGEDDWGQGLSGTRIDSRWNYNVPDASASWNYFSDTSEFTPNRHTVQAENDLELDAYEWFGFGLTNDPSVPVSKPLPARTKDFVIPKWSEVPELPVPDWKKYNNLVNWTRGTQWYREDYDYYYEVLVVPIMDYKDTLSTITVPEAEEE